MNLLHINDSLERGGAETLLVNTVLGIHNSFPAIKQTVITLYDRGELRDEIKGIVNYQSLNFNLMFPIPAIIKLRNLLKEHKIDVIHSHLLHSTFLSRLAKHSNLKLVSTYHSVFYDPLMVTYAKKELLIDKLTYRDKYYSIFVSNAVRENIMENVGIKRNYEVLLNFASSKFHHAYEYSEKPQLKVVMVGNLHEIKNHELAINTMAELNHLPISIDIYGEGSLRNKLQRLISKTNANVFLKGKQKISSKLLSQYDLFLMTSHHEGMPLSLIEALHTGLPCLLNDVVMLRETAGDAAIYYSYDSLCSLKSNLNNVCLNRKLLLELAGKTNIQSKKFSEKNYIEKLIQIYNK